VQPGWGCLMCNELISGAKLQEEALNAAERRAQRYVDEPEVPAPSVITLNSVVASHAVDDFLFNVLGLRTGGERAWRRFLPRTGAVRFSEPRADAECTECSTSGRFGRGDALSLPVKLSRRESETASS